MKVIIVEDVSKEVAYDIIQNSGISTLNNNNNNNRQQQDIPVDDSLNIESLQEFIDFNKIVERYL